MIRFLRAFELDRTSFWLGFLGGILFWWFLWLLRPLLRRGWDALRDQIRQAREGMRAGTEIRHRNDLLRLAQTLHIASPLFSLDEILIDARVLEPAFPSDGARGAVPSDITARVVPYMPEWPDPAASYRAPSLTLSEALEGGANLILLGNPGNGKTVALAGLTIALVREEISGDGVADLVPFYIHAGDLDPELDEDEDSLDVLLGAIRTHASTLTARGLPQFVQTVIDQGRALVLLDGLDELPQRQVNEYVAYLDALLADHPTIRVVVAASPEYYDGLPELGFIPLALRGWDRQQQMDFLEQWGQRWTRFVDPELWALEEDNTTTASAVERTLLDGWVQTGLRALTPLELTLKVWAAYAGDMLGPGPIDAIEAYIARMTVGSPKARPALEQLAQQMVVTESPLIARREAGRWVAEFDEESESEPLPAEEVSEEGPEEQPDEEILADTPGPSEQPRVSVRRTLPSLLQSGLLSVRGEGGLSFQHPVLLGYLAGSALAREGGGEQVLAQPPWEGRQIALTYMAACGPPAVTSALAQKLLLENQEPLQSELLTMARWLRTAPETGDWRPRLLRQLAKVIQDDLKPVGLRARAMSALAATGDGEVSALFRHLFNADYPSVRQLAALGAGLVRDSKAVNELAQLMYDATPAVRRAACLALINIGDQPALDAVASALLQGDEDLRRAAAEAFANHPEEGFPLLREGASIDDLLVRRAVVFGLMRVGEPWAIEVLEKMQVEDGQWVVRNAATQALEDITDTDAVLPHPISPLHETPWLIEYAGKRGMGIAAGKPAQDQLISALHEGDSETRQAAVETLAYHPNPGAIVEIYNMFYGPDPDLREAANKLLWHFRASGIDLPSPTQFGLG